MVRVRQDRGMAEVKPTRGCLMEAGAPTEIVTCRLSKEIENESTSPKRLTAATRSMSLTLPSWPILLLVFLSLAFLSILAVLSA
jgi:hypothetical protein